jgi:hypothetical protein
MAKICELPYFEYEGPRNNEEYRNIRVNEELLRRIESLERKVDDLQNRNKKLENIIKQSFMSFKFLKEEENNTLTESEAIRRIRMIRGILDRR